MKIEQLTFTRFVAALMVLFFHYFGVTNFFEGGYLFVSFFYVLSGFVLLVSQKKSFFTRKEVFEFYLRRVARIYPVYLFSILLFVITQQKVGWGIILNIAGVQAFFPAHVLSYNAPGWSISVEFFFYFSFPFLIKYFYCRYPMNVTWNITLCFWLITQILCSLFFNTTVLQTNLQFKYFLLYNPLNHLNSFIIGIVAGLLYKKFHKRYTGNFDLHLFVSGIIICAYIFSFRTSFEIFDHNGLLSIFFGAVILCLSLNNGLISFLFQKKILVFAGEISFCLYILSEPVLLALKKIKIISTGLQGVDFSIFFLILLTVSCIVHLLLEKPLKFWITEKGMSFSKLVFPRRIEPSVIDKE